MLRKILVGLTLALIITTLAKAETTHAPLRGNIAPEGQNLPQDTRSIIDWTITRYAFVYGVDEDLIHKVVFCESSYNPNAENISGVERSYGLSQINTMAHPHITKEQAKDIDFAIRFMAENISKGKGKMWTCYRKVA